MAASDLPDGRVDTAISVLLVDDDPAVSQLLARYLGGRGVDVRVAPSLAALRRALAQPDFDVILLDLSLPDGDGLTALRDIRAHWTGPVLIVSGRSEATEHVLGLEAGADDFVDKPFDLRELLARIHAALRRATPVAAIGPVRVDGLEIDLARRRVTGRDGSTVALTEGEFEILAMLLRRPLQAVSREALMSETRGRTAGPFDRTIDVQVARLRHKIERDPAQPTLVQSVRGVGYRLGEVPEPTGA